MTFSSLWAAEWVAKDIDQLNRHLDEHLRFTGRLIEEGVLPISGPFFTEEGKNTGNGFYVLKVPNIEQACALAAQDPLHKNGVRVATVQPWLQVIANSSTR